MRTASAFAVDGLVRGREAAVCKGERPDARQRHSGGCGGLVGSAKKSATGDVALKITTKGGWRSALKPAVELQYINSFLNTKVLVKHFSQHLFELLDGAASRRISRG